MAALLAGACRSPEQHVGAVRPKEPGAPSTAGSDPSSRLGRLVLQAPTPYIPPQCYTKTRDPDGRVHNPCFACHNRPRKPNYVDDTDLQLTFAFPEPARKNPWTNLFVDRQPFVNATSDALMLEYVRTSNYADENGNLLARKLESLPPGWDGNKSGTWDGYLPDAGFDFDAEGFDHDAEGRLTGWRAYAYHPFVGTFWPTNGSAGDVLIRLPEAFRQNEAGEFDREVYELNLAVVEALTKREDVAIDAVDERRYGVDLDKNGKLGTAHLIRYDWAPREHRTMSYVGQARLAMKRGEVEIAAGLLPRGTELLHSVRYLDVVDGRVTLAARMKELRYARKVGWQTYSDLQGLAAREVREKRGFPDRPRQVVYDLEHGVSNNQGWRYQGFIEDATGALRPQSYEETAFCVGCHGGISATTDGVFSFARKRSADAPQRGWYHWTQYGLEGTPDLKRADDYGEYLHYLEQNGAGDELRANAEVLDRYFDKGVLLADVAAVLSRDVSRLIVPSPERALALDKAYWAIVREQSFIRGRDAVLTPALNVHRVVEEEEPTGITTPVSPAWMSPRVATR